MTPDPPAEPGLAAADVGRAIVSGPAAQARAARTNAEAPAARPRGEVPVARPQTETSPARPDPVRPDPVRPDPVRPDAKTLAGGPEELYELGARLLDHGDAATAAEVFAIALERLGAGHPGRGQLLGGLGIARLEQALGAFAEAVECGDVSVRPLAVELLARALPLRDRDDEAALVWQRGVADDDLEVAAEVRSRLRRAFGVDEESAPEFWWDGFVESAVCHGTLPVLASELFGALDHMYALVAVPYVREAHEGELWQALAAAVRVPSGYAWGPDLRESFRERLRDAIGADRDALPPDWPNARLSAAGHPERLTRRATCGAVWGSGGSTQAGTGRIAQARRTLMPGAVRVGFTQGIGRCPLWSGKACFAAQGGYPPLLRITARPLGRRSRLAEREK